VRRWWRRWSPWRLRAALADVRDWLNDERAVYDGPDTLTTAVEVVYRYAASTLLGDADPQGYAEQFSVKGRTLYMVLDSRPTPVGVSCLAESRTAEGSESVDIGPEGDVRS